MPYVGALKRCGRCRGLFPPAHFNRDRTRPDGLAARCRACANAATAESREVNRARALAQRIAYNDARPERHYGPERGYRPLDRAYALILRCDPCAFCGKPADGVARIDAGAGHRWTNLTATCKRCRMLKRGTPLLLFLVGRRVDLRPRRRRRAQ